ncbi:MAG: cell division protein FtsQ/DivIB [Gallionellaceae bacterium]
MWNDAQALSKLSGTLLGVSLLLLLFGALHFTLHLPVFALRVVQLVSVPQHENAMQIEAVVRNELHGNFFTMDLEQARQALEKLPWVRKASLRRHFPWQLDVELQEQVALAHWNGDRLVNTFGEVFAAQCERVEAKPPGAPRPPPCGETNQALPYFVGPGNDSAAEVTQKFEGFSKMLAPIRQEIGQISLSPRHAWQLRLKNGMVLELGREQMEQRLGRFTAVYPYSLATVQQPVRYVDLRYHNGFAAYLPSGKV